MGSAYIPVLIIHVNLCMLLFWGMMLVKGKAIPIIGRGGQQGCETSRLPHFLDNWLTDGSDVK
jgi:hypothetical protein